MSVEEKIKQKAWHHDCITEVVELETVLKELGVVAQKIRQKIDAIKKEYCVGIKCNGLLNCKICLECEVAQRISDFKDVLEILEDEKPKDTTKIFEELTIQAKMLGFNYVDLYIPDKQSDELVAFTFSKSEEYSKIIQDVEVGKVVVEREKLRELADLLKNRPHRKSTSFLKWFDEIEKKLELLFDVESTKDTKKESR